VSILLAAPMPAEGEQVAAWIGLQPTWTGWDGSTWNLSDPTSGVMLLRGGTRGLTMPPVQRLTSDSPGVPGSRHRGYRVAEREVFWPLFVFKDSDSAGWVEHDRAFWRTMHPDRPGVWSVSHPDGGSRSLRCRFVDDGEHAFDLLPVRFGWAKYGVTLVAEQPFWQGQPIIRSWKAADPVDFFGSGAPDFHITPGSTLADAVMDNPGDEPAHVTWTVHGPTSSVEVGVGGRIIEVPFPLAEGESLTIDTAPTAQTAIDSDGVERTAELGEVDFAPLPPGQSVSLSLNMVGSGMVSATITPLYHRAW
jgi:hypothetical protein